MCATGADGSDGGTVLVAGNAQLAISGATEGFGLTVFNGGNVAFTGSSTISVNGAYAYGLFSSNGGMRRSTIARQRRRLQLHKRMSLFPAAAFR